MSIEERRFPATELRRFIRQVFESAGLPTLGAQRVADSLIWANLRGVDSHGVLRTPWYVQNIDTGVMNPRPNVILARQTPSTVLIEADRALGAVVTVDAIDHVVDKASLGGIGLAIIRNHTHQGAIGFYTQMITQQGMAGIAIACNPPNMAPFGAKVPGVHNSPISIAVPGKRNQSLLLDMATSVAAGGKLWLAQDKGAPIPLGWALDSMGNPTTDPNAATVFLPVGGPKGSGLALLFECLTSLMALNPLVEPTLSQSVVHAAEVQESGDTWKRPKYLPRHNQNSLLIAIDISAFSPLEQYVESVDQLIDAEKRLPTADGFDEVLVPGELEERTQTERMRNGLPLPQGTIGNLNRLADRFGLDFPEAVAV